MKKIFLIFLLFSISGLVSGEVYHSVESDDQRMDVNTTIELECTGECPVNSWDLSYTLPDNSEIMHIEDSFGPITEYEHTGNSLELSTNSGERRMDEYVKIDYEINTPADEVKEDLYTRSVSFAGFGGQKTSGIIEVDNLISGRASYGFETSYGEDLRFSGQGPVRLDFNFGNGTETEYYSFFSEINNSKQSYEIALGTVGSQQNFDRFPVAVFDEEAYVQGSEDWSSGEYRAGLIRIREDDEMRPVLTHETVHGLNSDLLSWDSTDSAWFDEGVAKHAESLHEEHLYNTGETDRMPPQLFGEDVEYTNYEENVRYTFPSRGDRDELWNYYQSEASFMKSWRPGDGNREFGYAYSELVVKNFLYNGGDLHELYGSVDPGQQIESNDEKWSIYSEHMELEPCNYESRDEFDQCLDEINDHDFDLRVAQPVENEREDLNIDSIDVPDREPMSRVSFQQRASYFLEKALEALRNLVQQLI